MMTIKYDDIYINEVSTVAGKIENEGPLSKYFDKTYNDYYMGKKTWEQAEMKMIVDSVDILLNKANKTKKDIDLFISGDLLNQNVVSNYSASTIGINYLGIYNACATSVEGIIIGCNMLSNKTIKNCICTVSSHNLSAEKQFRNPTEYGTPKPKTATFTSTGACCALLSKDKSNIRIESTTIGKVIDLGIKDTFHMGAAMAPSAAYTIYNHLKDLKREPGYYDLIVTGDLGKYGKNILRDYLKSEYSINLENNYDDCGCMLYNLSEQDVFAGASGPASSALVTYSYIIEQMKRGKYNKVLLVATGALMSPTTINQKLTIPSIAHAVSLEVVE
jgi:stage V sporulation protein AD